MTLKEAWNNIRQIKEYKSLSANQVYSILCDLGVFIQNPKSKVAVKIGLQSGLWDAVKNPKDDYTLSQCKGKLSYFGFAENIIEDIFESLQECSVRTACQTDEDVSANEINACSISEVELTSLSNLQIPLNMKSFTPSTPSPFEILNGDTILDDRLLICEEWNTEMCFNGSISASRRKAHGRGSLRSCISISTGRWRWHPASCCVRPRRGNSRDSGNCR